MSELSDSIAKLHALRERIRKAEEAAIREEQLRKESENSATKLVMENADIKTEVTKEKKAVQEVQQQFDELDSQKSNLEKQLQNIQRRFSDMSDDVEDGEKARAKQKIVDLQRSIQGIESEMQNLSK